MSASKVRTWEKFDESHAPSLFHNLMLYNLSSLLLFICNVTFTPPINLGHFSDLSRSSSASAVVLRLTFVGFQVRQLHLTKDFTLPHIFQVDSTWSPPGV